jgi:hypothetical protein
MRNLLLHGISSKIEGQIFFPSSGNLNGICEEDEVLNL